MISRLRNIYRKLKLLPLKILIQRSPIKDVIEKDIDRWIRMNDSSRAGHNFSEKLYWLLYADNLEEFRNLVYYRIGYPTKTFDGLLLGLSKKLHKPLDTLIISSPSIGPGLVIKHGYGTVIEAEKIGENCLIFQDVVLGYKNETGDRPTIGNYVHVSVGSRILGHITVGDHAVIAANSVVTRDLPPNCLAVGIPARIIMDAGNKGQYIDNGSLPSS